MRAGEYAGPSWWPIKLLRETGHAGVRRLGLAWLTVSAAAFVLAILEAGEAFEAGKPWAGYVAQHAANDLDVHVGLGRKMGVEAADREPGSVHDARYARRAQSFAPGDRVR